MKTILIGQNASGKSNFLEAIVLLFKHLDLGNEKAKPEHLFEYVIIYTIGTGKNKKRIKIKHDQTEDNKYSYTYWLSTGERNLFGDEEFAVLKSLKKAYLPRYVFAYYSGLGNSNRLEEHFEDYKSVFAKKAKKASDNNFPEPPRMLYAELIHSQLSLLSFFIDNDPKAIEFLEKNLNIQDLKTILLTIQEPSWSNKSKKDYDPKFFGSQGVVKSLLYHLHDEVAYAPLRSKIKSKSKLWEKSGKKEVEVVYLYISDFSKVRNYVISKQWSSFDFFHILNTANVSRLINKEGIKISVKKKFADRISFKDLSEGEQQLLTVLGLMRFTVTDEALFLLDEPDTHLNPYWRWKYMNFIDEIVFSRKNNKADHSIQVIMSSHDPLTISGLTREEVRRFETDESTGEIVAYAPQDDPKGMGVAGILTEIFKLPTTLDKKTQEQLERRRHLESMKFNGLQLTDDQLSELSSLNKELDDLGFSRTTRDPLYQKFQARLDKELNYAQSKQEPLTTKELEEQEKLISEVLKDLLNEEGL